MKNFKEMQIEFERYIKSREKELANNFKDTFEDVRKELLKIYEKYEVDNKIDFDELRKYNRLKKFDDIVLSSIAANSLLNKKATNKILNDVINKTEKESLEIVNKQVTIQAIKRSFDTKALISKEVAGKAWEERLKHHTANFMYDVHGIVRRGLEQGDSYTTMARNVKKKFRKEVKKELFLVRTEARRIQEFTKFETMREVDKQVGLVKIWHTMKDEAVRSTHQAMEGVEVGMDEEFELPSGATCLTPTGTGIPEEDCNCRCFVEYKVADEGIKAIDEIDDEKENTDNQEKYTREEIDQALENYVSGDGMWINNHLRGIGEAADYPLNEDDKVYLEKLDQATKANIVKEKTLYRSTDISSVLGDMSDLDYDNLKSAYLYNDKSKQAQEALEKYLKNIEGKEIVDKGFMSTTKSKDIALDFQDFTGSSKSCVIEFNVANGVHGIDLKDFDIADMEQKEVLLARGQKFVIKEISQEQGQFYFKAELLAKRGYNNKVDYISGAITDSYSREARKHAELYYEEIRNQKTDVDRISKNTGYDKKLIEQIKNYLFYDEHEIYGIKRRFDPDFSIAQSWQRLAQNEIKDHDLVLIKHEIMEKELIDKGLTQDEAHKVASKKYNYRKESNEYYAKIKKCRKKE